MLVTFNVVFVAFNVVPVTLNVVLVALNVVPVALNANFSAHWVMQAERLSDIIERPFCITEGPLGNTERPSGQLRIVTSHFQRFPRK